MTAAESSDVTGPDWDAGLTVLTHHAARGVFSCNDCRSELRALGFSRYDTGALFLDAEQQKIIRQVGIERSTDRPTHGSRVARWTSADAPPLQSLIPRGEVLNVPARRDPDGRFTTQHAATSAAALFDLTPEGTRP